MVFNKSRRAFLGRTAAAGGFLLAEGIPGIGLSAVSVAGDRSGKKDPNYLATGAPVIVISETPSRDINPRSFTWVYIEEILQRAGIFFDMTVADALTSPLASGSKAIVVLAGDLNLKPGQREMLSSFVKNGGSMIGIGGTSGMDGVFGVRNGHSLGEGWIKAEPGNHPVTGGLRSSLHVFGGKVFEAETAHSLAKIETNYQGPKGSAILENTYGKGRTILLAPDLIFSIVNIQQGIPVLQDGKPSPDGTANVNDGELKAEDGMVLDWERDRTIMEPDEEPAFLEPITDELREIILRSIFYEATRQGISLPVLWYWPRGLMAVGHISHDTDGNEPEKAVAMLDVMKNRCKIRSTWDILYPGGYPKDFYKKLKNEGFEIGLHYDARTGGKLTSWSKKNFLFQKQWLINEAGIDRIYSNKNHYTRWENKIDFYRWCEEAGIESDETRGPSKKGAIGFALGGSQPYYPIDDEGDKPRIMNVLEINLITQDLVVVCPKAYGRKLLDSAFRHHGVAHFLFHPAHIQKPHVADALCDLVEYGKSKGLEWWTNMQIFEWEKQRRHVKGKFEKENSFVLYGNENLADATVMILNPRETPLKVKVNGKTHVGEKRSVYGFNFEIIITDLERENIIQTE